MSETSWNGDDSPDSPDLKSDPNASAFAILAHKNANIQSSEFLETGKILKLKRIDQKHKVFQTNNSQNSYSTLEIKAQNEEKTRTREIDAYNDTQLVSTSKLATCSNLSIASHNRKEIGASFPVVLPLSLKSTQRVHSKSVVSKFNRQRPSLKRPTFVRGEIPAFVHNLSTNNSIQKLRTVIHNVQNKVAFIRHGDADRKSQLSAQEETK
mmetsp:Transcript_12900/g.14775  ORF Transcript_12900/g.14775 Transcript_12900/m.14775 type:complete len:210 (-) Transcript_12900:265-894(-)